MLRAGYDEALSRYDLLLLPTTPMKATPIPPAGSVPGLLALRASERLANTSPFNASGHPAMSIPCAMSDGLPVGSMLVAKHFDEASIYRAAEAFEAADSQVEI